MFVREDNQIGADGFIGSQSHFHITFGTLSWAEWQVLYCVFWQLFLIDEKPKANCFHTIAVQIKINISGSCTNIFCDIGRWSNIQYNSYLQLSHNFVFSSTENYPKCMSRKILIKDLLYFSFNFPCRYKNPKHLMIGKHTNWRHCRQQEVFKFNAKQRSE